MQAAREQLHTNYYNTFFLQIRVVERVHKTKKFKYRIILMRRAGQILLCEMSTFLALVRSCVSFALPSIFGVCTISRGVQRKSICPDS